MKILSLLVSFLLILNLASQMEGRLLLTNGNGFFCFWTTKRTCSKTTPACSRITTDGGTTYTCKYYRTQCQFYLDTCKGSTIYGFGTEANAQTYCVTNNIAIGSTGTCT